MSIFKGIIAGTLGAFLVVPAFGQEEQGEPLKPLVIQVRGGEAEAERQAARLGADILPTKTNEFDNGNTFVRFEGSATSRKISVVLPRNPSANQLMEALISTYTAWQQHAEPITVILPTAETRIVIAGEDGFDAPIPVNLIELFKTAGAAKLKFGERQWALSTDPVSKQSQRLRPLSGAVVGPRHPNLAADLAKELELPLLTSVDETMSQSMVFYLLPSSFPVNAHFFQGLSDIAKMRAKNIQVMLVTPYLPYARTDKIDQPGVSITGRLVADLISQSGVKSISFVRAHAAQSEGFFSVPTFHAHGRDTINRYLTDLNVDMIISPDNGAAKESRRHANELGKPLAIIDKFRDPLTGKLTIGGLSSQSPIEGLRVALVDDETASGGTFAEGAEFLKKLGAKEVHGIVTALAGSAKKAVDSPHLDSLAVSNSIPVADSAREHITVLSIAPELAAKVKDLRLVLPRPGCQGSFGE